ncbi:TMEM43 family protein [Desulfococcaceae bacterium HSG7]|nr:TMEM43 family protein [Desulfococcaceae bacterium HSG7]
MKKKIPKRPNKSGSFKNTSDSPKAGLLIAGALLMLIGLGLLFLNENRNARRVQVIDQSGGPVIRLTHGRPNPAYDGKLVYITGITNIDKPITDRFFLKPTSKAIFLKASALRRQVEIYQWQEKYEPQTMKTVKGEEVTLSVPTYKKVWSSKIIDSAKFKKPDTHQNPRKMQFPSLILRVSGVSVGDFKLSAGLANQLNIYTPLQIRSKAYLDSRIKNKVQLYNHGYFIGKNPDKPEIGNMRITLQVVRLSEVSIIAKQEGNLLQPYITSTGKRIEILRQGRYDAEVMLPMPQAAPSWILWSFRLGGFILICFGITLILKAAPKSDPESSSLYARLAATDTGLSTVLIAPGLVLLPIAIAWIMVRPLSGAILLVSAILLAVAARFVLKWLSEPPSIAEKRIALAQNEKIKTDVPTTVTSTSTQKLTASDWLKKGQKMYIEENFNSAIDAFGSAIYLDSDLPLAYYNRAITYQKAGQPKLAIIDLKSAARLGHKRAQAFLKAKKIVWQ